MRKLNIFFIFLITLSAFTCTENNGTPDIPNNDETGETYQNPVFEPTNADPTIVKADDGYFYVYSTEDHWGDRLHLIPIIRSKDLVNWEFVGDAFETKPTWKPAGSLWAPDISRYAGKYYLFYSYSLWGDPNPGIGLAVSQTPQGPFTDLGKFFLSDEIGVSNSIDPFFFEDDNGKIYLFWGSFHGIYGIELNFQNDTFTTTGTKFQIAGTGFEATYIIKRNGYYYFFGSNGSCCNGENSTYNVRSARGENIQGPYTDASGNSLLQNNPLPGTQVVKANDGDQGFAGPGHNAEIVTDNQGNDWLVYHAIDKNNPLLPNGATRRPLLIDKLIWPNEWPLIEFFHPSTGDKPAPVFE